MNRRRNRIPLIAAITAGGFAACNQTVGECWYYGEGSESVGAGPGGGVILPTGPASVGSYGDAPPEGPQGATKPPPACNEGEDDATELGELVCKQEEWGATCMIACAAYGVSCPAGMPHSVTNALGQLSKCCNCKGDQRCWYTYDSGEKCVLRPETGKFYCGI